MTDLKTFTMRSADMPPDDTSSLGLVIRMFQEMKQDHSAFKTEIGERLDRMSEQRLKEAFEAGGMEARVKAIEASGKNYVTQDEFKEVSARMRTVDGIVKGLVVAVGSFLIITLFSVIGWFKGGK